MYDEGNNNKKNMKSLPKDMLNKIFGLVSHYLIIKKKSPKESK